MKEGIEQLNKALQFEVLEQATCSLGALTLRRYLREQSNGFEIRLEGRFLMATDGTHSERALARLAWERLEDRPDSISVLVAGLGVGETLAETLDIANVGEVVVIEVADKIVEWYRKYLCSSDSTILDDPRVTVIVTDLFDYLRSSPARFDLILLDIDNGPDNLSVPANRRLYDEAALRKCRNRLNRGGVLGVWSANPSDEFFGLFRRVYPHGEEVAIEVAADATHCPPDCIYLGVR